MVERTFEFTPDDGNAKRAIVLIIHTPVQVGEDWEATMEVRGFPGEKGMKTYGTDSMQALLLAVQFADFHVRSLARIHRGKLTLNGSPNLRLILDPIGWGSRLVQTLADLLGESRR